ncbi:MAG: S-layer homology domain-containing protein [Tissierellales bacterium]|nr:S-layer homology domain-containing protein [Tissierellales bacterium]MBN2828468.1 S-layer homology domain-containing protein [Tissierellales bacterium]
MTKNIAIVLTIQLISLFIFVMPVACAEDMNDWSKEYLNRAVQYKWMDEDEIEFSKATITRLEFIKIVIHLYDTISDKAIETEYDSPFDDTQDIAVSKAYDLGIVLGMEEDRFEPNLEITREQMMVILHRLLDALEIYPITTMEYRIFEDEMAISGWAKNSVQLLSKLGVVNGITEGQIAPKQSATLEQAIAMVVRMQMFINSMNSH